MECRSRDVSVCERVVLFHPLSSDCLITRSNWCCYSSYPTCKSEIYGADLRWCIYLPGSIILIVLETATIGLVILQRHSGALRPVQPVHQNSVFIQIRIRRAQGSTNTTDFLSKMKGPRKLSYGNIKTNVTARFRLSPGSPLHYNMEK